MSIKAFSIDSKVSEEFDKLAKKLNLNKSSFIEEKMREFLNSNRNKETIERGKKLSYESKYRIVEKQFEDRTEYRPEVLFVEKEVSMSIGGRNFQDDWHSVVFLNGNFNQNEWTCKTKEEAEKEIEKYKLSWIEYAKSKNLIKETIHEIE